MSISPEKTGNRNYILAKEAKDEKVAFKYYNAAKEEFLAKKDSLMAGKALVNMAIIMSNQGDYYGSQLVSIEANKILSPKDTSNLKTLSSNYNCLAIVSENLKQYDKSIEYYEKAIKITNDTIDKLAYLNNIGHAYLEKKEYSKALNIFKNILKSDQSQINKIDYARVLNNYARVNYLISKNYNPIPLYEKSYEIRKEENDLSGLNYVLASFVEFYQDKNIEKARMYNRERYSITKQMRNPDDQLEVLQKLTIQNPNDYVKYFNRFTFLNDSIKLARNSAKDQFALIRFETEESKAQNLKLQKDISENKYQIIKQRILTYGISVSSLVLGIFGIVWYKKRKQRMLLESENRLQEQQIRTSKKVHDKVANKVYHVMSEVENSEMNKLVLLDKLETIYHISRDISYEENDSVFKDNFSAHLSQMLKSYASDVIKIPIVGNEESLWVGVEEISRAEIFYILQELMTNMKKHSRANRVLISFEQENNTIKILYSDNGVGIQAYSPKNGLKNTESRINSIGGTINFDTKTEKGLKITLSFPVKN